jgi:hypothetical protein
VKTYAGIALAALALFPIGTAAAQGDDDAVLAIKAKRVITVSGEEFAPGMVLIRGGRIEAVGARIELPVGVKVIDAPSETVMPGLINARSRFGLRSYRRGGNNAHLSTANEVFYRDGDLGPALESGFVVLGLFPAGSGVPGNAVAVRPIDGSRAEILLSDTGYLRILMASMPTDKRTLAGTLKAAKTAIAREEKARKAFDEKKKKAEAAAKKAAAVKGKVGVSAPKKGAPAPKGPPKAPGPKGKPIVKKAPSKPATFTPPPIPPSLVPFVNLIRKGKDAPRVLLEVARASDLLHYDDAVKSNALEPIYYIGRPRSRFGQLSPASDLFHAAERLGKEEATLLLTPTISLEPYTKTRRNLAAEFARAGARIAFVPETDTADGFRKLLPAVAELVREGLARDVALRGLTLVPAEILGLGAELGTLEKGRRADLVFLAADPLETGASVTRVMIAGETVWSKEERP